ncbi:MAG: glycerophosphodiester phosphodiesterase [Geminicoccaceae bacterium]
MASRPKLVAALLAMLLAGAVPAGAAPLVIAHRGASGYLPEHTAEAQMLAVGLGADFVELDVVLSRDGVPVVLHDLTLDATTDVAARFPERARADGRFYAIDFDLAELATLEVGERVDPRTGEAVFPGRFPLARGFRLPTLDRTIDLVQGLEASTGRLIGLYVEVKRPLFHRQEGQDISRVVLEALAAAGYGGASDGRLYLQGFDWAETQRIRAELGYAGPLVQLIGGNDWADAAGTDYVALLGDAGLARLAGTVDGIGVPIGLVLDPAGESTGLAERAAALGLAVHAYTLRADRLPGWAADMAELVGRLEAVGVDGFFADQPDLARAALAPPER